MTSKSAEHIEALKKSTGIEHANCETCTYLGSDGDGPEYNGTWPVCGAETVASRLPTFPFKKEMSCWHPEFWHSKFADLIHEGSDDELDKAYGLFSMALVMAEPHSAIQSTAVTTFAVDTRR